MLTGGRFCGAIRYQANGTPFHATNCHCSICRRTTGAPFVTWFSLRPSDFSIVKGEPRRINTTEQGVVTDHDPISHRFACERPQTKRG
jgi:hypothetical protein